MPFKATPTVGCVCVSMYSHRLPACLPFFLFYVCHWVRVHTVCCWLQQKSLLCQRTWPEFLRRARSLVCALYSSPQLIEKFTLDDARHLRSHSRSHPFQHSPTSRDFVHTCMYVCSSPSIIKEAT